MNNTRLGATAADWAFVWLAPLCLSGAQSTPNPATSVVMQILVNWDQPADNARVRYREIGGELRTLNSDNAGLVTFEVHAPAAIWIDKANCLPQFSVISASELGTKSIERTCKLDGGFPLDVVCTAPDPAMARGIVLRLRGLQPDSVEYGGALDAFESTGAFDFNNYDTFARALNSLAQCEGGGKSWARKGTTDASGALHWMIPGTAKKTRLYVKEGLPVFRCQMFQEGQAAEELECDEFATFARVDSEDEGLGTPRPFMRLTELPPNLAARTRVEIELESLVGFSGRFTVEPREGFLAARSAVELQRTVDMNTTANPRDVRATLLLGQSALDSRAGFAFSRLPWSDARAVGVYAWIRPSMPSVFCAQIFDATVEARREKAALNRRLELGATRSGPRSLDLDFRAQDEKQNPLPISSVLEPGRCFSVAIRPLPVLSPDGSGSWTPSAVQWRISVPPSERLHLEGLPMEPFFLFVDPLQGDVLSHEYELIHADPPSDLDGVYLRTYRNGNAPLRETVTLRLQRTAH